MARRRWSWRARRSSRRSAIVAPRGCGMPSRITRVGSPSVCESTTRIAAGISTRADARSARAATAASGIDLYGLDLGVEFARRGTLLATAGARALHAAERRVRIDARRVAVHADHPGLDA